VFAEHCGRGLKLVHVRRRDRTACIASLRRHCDLFPATYGYYTTDAEAAGKRMAAFHFGEMTRAEWDRLPLEERFGWYYDKTHALVDGYKSLFETCTEIETEALDDEETRRTLARIAAGSDAVLPPKTHIKLFAADPEHRRAAAAPAHPQSRPAEADPPVAGTATVAGPALPEPGTNDLEMYAHLFDGITPWSGIVPAGHVVDFLGNVTPKEFFEPWGANPVFVDGCHLDVPIPSLGLESSGEDFWFEAVDWVLAARSARGRFVMMTLGALYGYQAVGCWRMLQLLNPMPSKLVAVEPIPGNVLRMKALMRANGIDPDQQWIVQAVVSDSNEPAFFPLGAVGAGSQNCVSTDNQGVREYYLKQFIMEDRAAEALEKLLLHNSTGLEKEIVSGENICAEIKLVSCVTLGDLLGPFERVDYIEADMQESEIRAFPPFLDLLRRKVKRIHIATHGRGVHADLLGLFASTGWRIAFDYAPESTHPSPWGEFTTNDGVLSVVNPDL
jgi:hypothetical protein